MADPRRPAAAPGSRFAPAGFLPPSAVNADPSCGPETRTMAIALGGRPDDNAKMV